MATAERIYILPSSKKLFKEVSSSLSDGRPNVYTFKKTVEEKDSLNGCYRVLDTPLSTYTHGMRHPSNYASRPDFGKFIQTSCDKAVRTRKIFSVLDIGVGTGAQWVGLVKKYSASIEFCGTCISVAELHPKIADRVVSCAASEINLHFPADHFDIVVSHYGLNSEIQEGFENAHYALKIGGVAMLTGREVLDDYKDPYFNLFKHADMGTQSAADNRLLQKYLRRAGKYEKHFRLIQYECASPDIGSTFIYFEKTGNLS